MRTSGFRDATGVNGYGSKNRVIIYSMSSAKKTITVNRKLNVDCSTVDSDY